MTIATSERLALGTRVRFGGDRLWWTVQAADSRYVVLTRQAEFKPKGESAYTIIDWVRDLRGPCNLIGQGWDVDEPNGCDELLRALNYHLEVCERLEGGEESVTLEEPSVEVSYRNNVPIEITEVRA